MVSPIIQSLTEEISITTLDSLCRTNNIKKINLLKMDVEGFEIEVLQGAKGMLPSIDIIQFEFSFANFYSKTYLRDFFNILSNFRIYRILQDGIYEVKYLPQYEIFMTTNYLAINNNTFSDF